MKKVNEIFINEAIVYRDLSLRVYIYMVYMYEGP